MYPWIQVTRRTNGAGSAILITKDDRSRNLLTDLKNINGKECAFRPLGNQAKKAYILMGVPTCVTEELLLQDKEVIEASRMTKWNTEKQQAEPTNLVKIVLVGKQHPVRFTRGYGSFRLRPFVSRPMQYFNCQKFGHQARTCRSEVQTCRYCAGRHASAQCKDNETRTLKCVNCGQGHAATSRLCPKKAHQTSQQDPSPHPIEERMDRIDHTRGGKATINTTNHNHPGTNGGKFQVKTVRKELKTNGGKCQTKTYGKELKAISEQETRTGKGSCRPSTSYQCLDKTTSAINDGISCSDVSKSVPSRTIGQARPTSRQATSNTPRKRGTNGRCTGNHTNSTHRCNISIKEDFCREHSSSTGTQENNGGSHGCYLHTHCIDDIVRYNGPFQGHRGCSHTACPTSNGPFQGHRGCSHTVCPTSNGRFQDHSCSHTVCVGTVLFRTTVVHIPCIQITVLFRTTVVHIPYLPVTVVFRTTVVHIRNVLKKVLFRTTVSHSPCTLITVLLKTTVVHIPYLPVTVLFRTRVVHIRYVLWVTGPFQDHSGSQSVSLVKGPFQGHSGSQSVRSR